MSLLLCFFVFFFPFCETEKVLKQNFVLCADTHSMYWLSPTRCLVANDVNVFSHLRYHFFERYNEVTRTHLLSAPPRLIFGVCVCASLHTLARQYRSEVKSPSTHWSVSTYCVFLLSDALCASFFCQWVCPSFPPSRISASALSCLSFINWNSPFLVSRFVLFSQVLFFLSPLNLCLFHSLCFFLSPPTLEFYSPLNCRHSVCLFFFYLLHLFSFLDATGG